MSVTSSIPPNLVPLQNGVLPFAAGGAGQSQGQYINVQLVQFTANGASAVTVALTGVTANSLILYAVTTVAGTPAGPPYTATITAGTGFTVKAVAGDTSVYTAIVFG